MGRNSSFPILFDEIKSISITDLKKMHYLTKNKKKGGVINWLRLGEKSGSISVEVLISDYDNYILFSYNCNDNSYNYRVNLVSTESNLNKGEIWYFLCSQTGMRCRKLHLLNGIFQHRTALKTGMYSKQTESKNWRGLTKYYGSYFDSDNLYKELYSKYFKTHYKGKPTKRYLRILNKLKQAN
jgi:hypothetical protein